MTQGAPSDMTDTTTDFLLLRNKKIPVTLADISQSKLKFYLENPRLYSLAREEGHDPTQEEVEDLLAEMDHVKQLVQSIKENGGLIDPVIVQGGSNIVLEGNSRLAAYRLLAKQDPIKWGLIRAKVLPADIGEAEIFSLLGEYHIIGKKDWAPFEQAGYLYRRHISHKITIDQLARDINIGARKIGHLIDTYQFMLDNGERDVERWSYYDEYLKSNIINRAREKYPTLDEVIVKKIKSGEIQRAVDVRDDLKKIVEAGGRVLEKFVLEKKTFDQSVDAAIDKGVGDHSVRHVKKFKEWLGAADSQADIHALEGEPRNQCVYDLNKIQALVERVLRKLGPKS
jgi:hypothetical protein